MTIIRDAEFPTDAMGVLDIWREYVASTGVSLDFQGYEAEFADLPGKYGRPSGCLLLAERDGWIEGCVGLRKVTTAICEMKRLYVRPRARGCGLGSDLVTRLIVEARRAGYVEIRLDVLAEFDRARAMYDRLGFGPAEAVTDNPVPGTAFLGLIL